MPHTNAWSNLIPLGSDLAGHIDDDIRQLRLDVFERMNDIVVDWTADPIVLKPISSNDNHRYIPFSLFLNDMHAKETDITTGSIHAFRGSGPYVAGLSAFLPFHITVTRIIGWINRDAANTVSMTLYQIPFSTGGASAPVIAQNNVPANVQLTTTTGTNQPMDTGTHDIVFDDANMYILVFDSSGGSVGDAFEIYGAEIFFHPT
jgi:hypothetical protein